MFKIFKIKIPKDNAQEVSELESYTVSWEVKRGWGDDTIPHNKVFIQRNEAIEFEKQLTQSAKFIGAWISTKIIQN